MAGADRCLVVLVACGCGTLPDGSRWGERATPAPGWDRIAWAAERNALDLGTWILAAGAVVFGVDEWDERVSDWARVEAGKHYPEDVLRGAAIGHFLSGFIHDPFLGLPRDDGPRIEVTPAREGVAVSLVIDF